MQLKSLESQRRETHNSGFYHGPEYMMCKPCRVVSPCGFTMDEQFIWVVFGRQDHEIWMAKLDKKGLYDNMEQCNLD